MALTYYDIAKFNPKRTERKIIVCGERGTPELNMLAPKVRPGTEYETPRLRDQGNAEIWVRYGEGAADLRTDFDSVITKAYGLDVKTSVPVRTLEAEDLSESPLGMSRLSYQLVAHTANIRRKMVKQLYLGQSSGDTQGMIGFPDVSTYVIDALSVEWNGVADFSVANTNITANQAANMADGYLIKAAPSAESDGLALFWGNNRTIKFGEAHIDEVQDPDKPGCSYEAVVRHIYGDVGLQAYCNQDVIRITNIPTSKVDGFSLDTVLSRVYSIFTDVWKPSHVLLHRLSYHAWWETRQIDRNDGVTIRTPSADGSFGGMFATWNPFGLPIIDSENVATHAVETVAAQTHKDAFEAVRDDANVPSL